MTPGMKNSAAQLIAIHHNEPAKVALQYVWVAVVAIDDGAGNRIRDVAPAYGKRLEQKIIVSDIDRNGKKGKAEAKSRWGTPDLALSRLCFRRIVVEGLVG
jgi:hypothetical protein